MSIYNATSFDAVSADAALAEPQVRKMRGLPRAAVWVLMIGAPWAVIAGVVRLVF